MVDWNKDVVQEFLQHILTSRGPTGEGEWMGFLHRRRRVHQRPAVTVDPQLLGKFLKVK